MVVDIVIGKRVCGVGKFLGEGKINISSSNLRAPLTTKFFLMVYDRFGLPLSNPSCICNEKISQAWPSTM